ncbi:MAG: hypothetical protein OXD30_06055 [Bryobacterales bacterium]|nr:hypothetical protein [Bryobacterales bacterium]
MEKRLKQLIQRLGHAIDESLSDSEAISAVIGEIKQEGYDVLLVLEATIGFSRRADKDGEGAGRQAVPKDLDSSLTPHDQQFLKSLSITLEKE